MTHARFGSVSALFILIIIIISVLAISVSASPPCRCRSDDNPPYVYLECIEDVQEVLPSDTITYSVIVHNLVDENITYTPPSPDSFSLPTGWIISFSPDSGMFIPVNKFKSLLVNLTAPSDAEANDKVDLKIIGTTSNPEAEIIPCEMHATVSQLYGSDFNLIDRIIFASPTEPKNLEVAITNTGNGDDRLAIELKDIPEGLTLSEEAQEFYIAPASTEHLTITMFPSSILTAGEYKLNISLYRISTMGRTWVSSQDLWVEVIYYPDLYVTPGDIETSKYQPTSGEDILINITINNIGDSDGRNIKVSIVPVTRFGSPLQEEINDQVIEFVGVDQSATISIPWKADKPAVNKIQVIIDPDDSIGELNEENNIAEYPIFIRSERNIPPDKETTSGEFSIVQISAVGIIALLCGIVAATFLSTEYGKFGALKLLLPFYTRVKKDEVLNHEVRELVYDYVRNHPGEHFRAILTKLQLTNGTLVHHLNTLERQEFIKSERDGPFKRFYPSGRQFTENVLEINGIQKKILDAISASPGITQKILAQQLQTTPPTINYHVKALREVRLINIKRDGKNTRCFPGNSLNGWYRRGEVS